MNLFSSLILFAYFYLLSLSLHFKLLCKYILYKTFGLTHLFFLLRWFVCRHPRTSEKVPIPPLRGDSMHNMTVLPYLFNYHSCETSSDNEEEFITEKLTKGKYLNLLFY